MSQDNRQLSVKEKIDQLERGRTGLNPTPVFDSRKNMAAAVTITTTTTTSATAGKMPSPPGSPEESRKIRVIKQNDADGREADGIVLPGVTLSTSGSSNDTESPKLSVTVDAHGESEGIRIEKIEKAEQDEQQTTPSQKMEGATATSPTRHAGKHKTEEENDLTVAFNGVSLEDESIDFTAKTTRSTRDNKDSKNESSTMRHVEYTASGGKQTDSDSDEDIKCEPIGQDRINNIMKRFSSMDKEKKESYLEFFWTADTFRYGFFTIRQFNNAMFRLNPRLTWRQVSVSGHIFFNSDDN